MKTMSIISDEPVLVMEAALIALLEGRKWKNELLPFVRFPTQTGMIFRSLKLNHT